MNKYIVKYHVWDVALTFITNAISAEHAKLNYIQASGDNINTYDYLEVYPYVEDIIVEDTPAIPCNGMAIIEVPRE